MTEVANSAQVGTTVISVDQLLSKEQEITSLKEAKSAADQLIAAKDQIIENLQKEVEDNQKVIIYEESRNSWNGRRRIVETKNLSSLLSQAKEDAKKEAEESVNEELTRLRLLEKTHLQDIADLKASQEKEISREQQRALDRINENDRENSKREDELRNSMEDLKSEYAKNIKSIREDKDNQVSSLTKAIDELNLKLQDKSKEQKLEKQIAGYKETIEKLTALVSGNFITKTINALRGKTANKFNEINNLLRDLIVNTTDKVATRTEIPSYLNKYAACKIYKEKGIEEVDQKSIITGYYPWGEPCREYVGKNIQWVAFEV